MITKFQTDARNPFCLFIEYWPVLFCVAFLILTLGCSNNEGNPFRRGPSIDEFANLRAVSLVTKNEIVTRRWTATNGTTISLLKFEVHKISGNRALAMAEYGDRDSGNIGYVDIYEYYKAIPPDDSLLFLLCHDSRLGWVTDIAFRTNNNQIVINFIRDIPDPEHQAIVHNSYSYCYSKINGLTATTGDFYGRSKLE